jgi:phage-related minor tail protein
MELFKLFGSILIDNDEANKSIQKTDNKAKKTGKTFSGMIGTVGKWGLAVGAAAAGAAAAVGVFAFKTANELDDATKKIRLGAGATGKALEDLRKDFDVVFKGVPASADTVSTAIADLNTRTGQTGESLQELSIASINLANLTGGDLATQIENTTRLFGDWGIEGENQVGTLDKLWNVSQTTGIGVDELAQKMVQFGAPLRQMGFDFETSSALMGKWEKEGVNAELVLGSLRIALSKMAKEGITDTNAALTEMIDKIKNAGSTGEANLLAMEQFGSKAGPDMAAAIREGRFELDGLIETLADSPETIQRATDDTLRFSEKFTMLKNRIALAVEPLGQKLLPLVEKFADFLTKNMPLIEEVFGRVLTFMSEKFTELKNKISGETFPIFEKLSKEILPRVIEVFKNIYEIYIPALMGIIEQVFPIIQTIITEVINGIVDYVLPPLITILEFLYTEVMPEVLAIFERVLPSIQKLWEQLWKFLEPQLWLLKKIFDLVFPEIAKTVMVALNEIEYWINLFLDVITYVLESINNFSDNWNIVWNAVGEYVSDIWEGIKNDISGVINWISDKVTWVFKQIDKVKNGAKAVGNFLGFGGNNIDGARAEGGPIKSNKTYLVGEKGPELFSPKSSGTIIPNDELSTGNNRSSTGTIINLTLTGNTIMNDNDVDVLGDVLVKRLRMLGVVQSG